MSDRCWWCDGPLDGSRLVAFVRLPGGIKGEVHAPQCRDELAAFLRARFGIERREIGPL